MALPFMWRSMIHFELIFFEGYKTWSRFFFFFCLFACMSMCSSAVCWCPSFLHFIDFASLSKTNWLYLCRSISGAQPFSDLKMKRDGIFHWSGLPRLPLAGCLKAVVSRGVRIAGSRCAGHSPGHSSGKVREFMRKRRTISRVNVMSSELEE